TWIKGCTGIYCELFAIWCGLALTWDIGAREVLCGTDCLEVFLAIRNGDFNMAHQGGDILIEIQEILQGHPYSN
ncbi:hypothetical protein PIB30_104233, partial [Stylosanthes scabra]|nr:hypothetical protein [Stylosanthes scabra]